MQRRIRKATSGRIMMSDDTVCKREVNQVVGRLGVLKYPILHAYICNKPKNPEHLYCPDCEREVLGER